MAIFITSEKQKPKVLYNSLSKGAIYRYFSRGWKGRALEKPIISSNISRKLDNRVAVSDTVTDISGLDWIMQNGTNKQKDIWADK